MGDKIQQSISELLKPRSIITLIVFSTACALTLMSKPIPDLIARGCEGLFVVWFGEKVLDRFKK